jgi:wobble nucleotide-excising tRNase
MKQFAKIADHKFLVRDMYSKAVLTTDSSVVRKHDKRMLDLQKEEIRSAEITSLKNDMKEIKDLLRSLVTGINIK